MKHTHINIDSKFETSSSEVPLLSPSEKREIKSNSNEIIQVAKHSSISYYFVIPILLGLFLGFELDKKFDSKPIFVLSGILIGSVSAFYNMKRLLTDGYFGIKTKEKKHLKD